MSLRPNLALTLVLPLLNGTVLVSACADDSTAMTSGTDPTTGSTTAGPATDGPTTATATTPTTTSATTSTTTTTTATATSPTTTDPDTTTGPDTTTTTDTTDTTGGAGVCGIDGDSVSAELTHDDQPAPCGPLEFTGTRLSPEKGPIWQLDGCACGDNCLIPDPWSLTVAAPAPWLPLLPACPRIVVERAMGFGVCEFVAMSVWDLAAPGAPAVYHAGHGFAPTQAAAGELTVTPHSVDTCDCDGCCGLSELWDLEFDLQGAALTLIEGATGMLGGHNAINFESHATGLCDAPLDVHWVIRQPA